MSDKKYEQRKKMIYDFMCDSMYVPMKIKELAIVLGVKKEQRPQLEQILDELMAEGKIERSKRGKFSKSEVKKITGTFLAHPKGFGFVSIEERRMTFLFRRQIPMAQCIWILLRYPFPR